MKDYQQNLQEEKDYLTKVMELIYRELDEDNLKLAHQKSSFKDVGKEIYENTASYGTDFESLVDITQQHTVVTNQAAVYHNTLKQMGKYEKMLHAPYFGRFDFQEEGFDLIENIYVGICNLMDSKTHDVYIYDWRAPISSIFYRFEPGPAAYDTPSGQVAGIVGGKRQYKIRNGELKYFFDCSIRINDDILQDVLSRNSSPKMRNIIETIQKEQDIIIRDLDNQLLTVQGVAGSGKTSIALHRVAFLLYEGLGLQLAANNILIISPNGVFSNYISTLLPELGEENVMQSSIEDIFNVFYQDHLMVETRSSMLEKFINMGNSSNRKLMQDALEFKGSRTFITILNRLLQHFEHKLIPFADVYYEGKLIETRQLLKNFFLKDKTTMPVSKRLKRIEQRVLELVHPLRKPRLVRLEAIVARSEGHDLEIKPYSRYLAIKEAKAFMGRLHKFTTVDPFEIYKRLFKDRTLFDKVTEGLVLPKNINEILNFTLANLEHRPVAYQDAMPLLYIKLKLEGNDLFTDIKQVVVDEAQDYYPLHYEVLNLMFPKANYTVLGDYGQAIERQVDAQLYHEVGEILDKPKMVKVFMNKSYRASYEINQFTQSLLYGDQEVIAFERHEEKPSIVEKSNLKELNEKVSMDIKDYLDQGFESVAIICKTSQQAEELYHQIQDQFQQQIIQPNTKLLPKLRLITDETSEIEKGVMIIPGYLAKGLEFDVVLVYNVSSINYADELDKKLLYIACTRALHRLGLYYWGELSPWIKREL